MDVFYYYTYGTAAWLGLQATPLLVSPTLIVTMLSTEVREPTVLEAYFCRALGMALLTVGVLTILLTGSVPLTSSFSETATAGTSTNPEDPKAPYALPTLTITGFYHAAAAFYGYTRWTADGQASYALSTVVYALFAAIALWCVLFASSNGRISRKTGADKRTSGFPFKNKEADKRKAERKEL
ncbi:hypothetical protein L228DRAFT_11537 [Xylona heveae TC161]|uniref:Uncharacterized protein n=1 Tax=Xylona heveae (strain CBS 132557 / TC161) TaxID=1328760 RepID=A0A165JLI0_XYLHT|nr:hypothetical protein L228DRAFT_11537 [Xylona heveae TC161]KZF26389.1 hypothetical protein L228DRAFT_11537 [Xylona heveae TC161]